MSAHTCKTLTDGCYRCDLNRDEIAAMREESLADAEKAWLQWNSPDKPEEWRYTDTGPIHKAFIAGIHGVGGSMSTLRDILAVIGFLNVAGMVGFAWLVWANERAGRRPGERAAQTWGGERIPILVGGRRVGRARRREKAARQLGGWR